MAEEGRNDIQGGGGGMGQGGDMGQPTSLLGHVVRFIVSALVLMLVGYIVPGFSRLTFGNALIAAIAIAAVGYLIEMVAGKNISPYGHGIVGFIVSAVVIYAVQFFVPGLSVSMLGALLAAVVIGIIDMFVPTMIR
ncbi:MAG TPA: phage holin family protein [Firmicutes bacterium]|jgi:putative membrane protein|nr:phage holin family protein [Bacillota bacterium]